MQEGATASTRMNAETRGFSQIYPVIKPASGPFGEEIKEQMFS